MIAANKNLLKATLSQGVLTIQTQLVKLYTRNLSAIATQAALIGGFAFSAVVSADTISTTSVIGDDVTGRDTLQYFYYTSFTISFISALVILANATLVVTLGPSMALKGETESSVKIAASHMFRYMIFVYKIASLCISLLFLGTCVICWSKYPTGIAVIATCCYFLGYAFVLSQGGKVYSIFENAFIDSFDTSAGGSGAGIAGMIGGKGYKPLDSKSDEDVLKANELIEATKLKARGIIWKRQPIEEGGLHVKCYAVMERGMVDFFKSLQDFQEGKNPINNKPVRLWEVSLETDPRKYSQKAVSLKSAVASFVGTDDFAISDVLSSEHDLKYAAKHFKFALVPKTVSELSATTPIEFIAHNESAYNDWVDAFLTVTSAYDALAVNSSVEQTIRTGNTDVEAIVRAANNTY